MSVGSLLLLASSLPRPAAAQSAADQTPASPSIARGSERALWLDVRDSRARVVEDPTTAGIAVVEGGRDAEVLRIERSRSRAAGSARVVLYFDALLAEAGTYRRGAEALAAAAKALTELGTVQLVIADPEPRLVLATDDALALSERLGWLGASDRGQGALRATRSRARADLTRVTPGLPPPSASEQAARAWRAAGEEAELVATQSRRLLGWLADSDDEARGTGPQVLVLVADGWDLAPLDFWHQELALAEVSALAASRPAGADPDDRMARVTGEMARALAAAGWTVWPVAVPAGALAPSLPAEALDPLGESGGLFPTVGRKPQITLGGGAKHPVQAAEPEVELLAPAVPLKRLADESGGQVLPSIEALRAEARALGERVRVVYRSHLSAADGMQPLVVRARAGISVTGLRWASVATPDPILAARIDGLLHGREVDQALDVAAAITLVAAQDAVQEGAASSDLDHTAEPQEPQELASAAPVAFAAQLEARLSLATLDEPVARADLRVTVAHVGPDGELVLRHEVLWDQPLGSVGEWRYVRDLTLPPDGEETAVLIEVLGSRRWGAALAAVVHGERVEVAASAEPQSSVVEIQAPEQELLRGGVRFTARAIDSRVATVVFELGEREVARVERRPFSARIDLGRALRQQTLRAIALDGEGFEIGRQSVLLNAGEGALSVKIVSPEAGPAEGAVEVEALVTVPLEQPLDRVLFFWNNDLLATQYQAPFRQRITVPQTRPMGYVRVVAMLEDGTLAEDVVFLNGPQAGTRVDVNLVELYVVVTDSEGRPVRALEQQDFEIRDEGAPQKIAGFSDAGELPITLGLAIDSSASMFVKLPRVQQAATRFLGAVLKQQDRAFVVDFDSQPRLARGTTGDLPRVVKAIDSLQANGRTALWESVVFSLVQLQGVRGRKALIVFSDGADEDDHFPYRSSLKLAKQMGVPIYMILMKKRPKKGHSGFSLWNRSFTQRAAKLVEAGGGRVYYAREYASLDEVYEEIGQELRSQYLITYYPQGAARSSWRDVEIVVKKRGLKPRTLAGYWPE